MKKKIYIVGMMMLLVTFALAMASCDLFSDLGTSSYNSTTYDPPPSTPRTYTYYFINNSTYAVTVTIGGDTTTIPVKGMDWIDLTTSVTTFTYSPANLVKYTGALTSTITFVNR
jgi:hypothetical protein